MDETKTEKSNSSEASNGWHKNRKNHSIKETKVQNTFAALRKEDDYNNGKHIDDTHNTKEPPDEWANAASTEEEETPRGVFRELISSIFKDIKFIIYLKELEGNSGTPPFFLCLPVVNIPLVPWCFSHHINFQPSKFLQYQRNTWMGLQIMPSLV